MAGKINFTLDAKKVIKGKFKPSSGANAQFYKQLKKVAKASAGIVQSHVNPDGVTLRNSAEMQRQLNAYSKALEPWASRQSAQLLEAVSRSNKRAYINKLPQMGEIFKTGIDDTEMGVVIRAMMNEQVALIKSIPVELGERAQEIAVKAVLSGSRAVPSKELIEAFKRERLESIQAYNTIAPEAGVDQWREEMERTEEVAVNRAKLIARTETARANASINEARARSVGSIGYIWHATLDEATRESHRKMDGKFVRWDKPPTLSDGTVTHAGEIYNCRCYAEPVFED